MAAENIFDEIADWHVAYADRLRLAAEEVRAVKRELAGWKRAATVPLDLAAPPTDRADTERASVQGAGFASLSSVGPDDDASGASSDAAEARWTVRRVTTNMRELANLKAAERDMPVGDWLNEAIRAHARGQ